MMYLTLIILSSALVLSLFVNVWSLWQLRKLARYIFDLEDQVDESLDLLDDRYKKLDNLTQIPVLMDEPVIRQMLQHMRDARESIAIISKKIRTFGENNDENETQ